MEQRQQKQRQANTKAKGRTAAHAPHAKIITPLPLYTPIRIFWHDVGFIKLEAEAQVFDKAKLKELFVMRYA